MENFIQIANNGYTIKISLQNIQYSDISTLLKVITEDHCWRGTVFMHMTNFGIVMEANF